MESLYDPADLNRPPIELRRQWAKALLAAAAVLGLTVLYLVTASPRYLSEAKVYVRLGHESASLDPTVTTGQYLAVSENRETEINAVEELLASRSLAETVVDQFGPEAILEKSPRAGPSLGERLEWLNDYNLNPLRVYSLRDKAIKWFQQNLGITTGKKTNVVSVSYESEDAEFARDVLSALIEAAREEHLRVHRTQGSLEFFTGQVGDSRSQLAKLEEDLRQLKNTSGMSALATQREIQLELIGGLEVDLLKARAEQDALTAEVARRKQQLADLPSMIVTEQATEQPNTPRQAMRERLFELEVKERELAAKYHDGFPQLEQIRKQIAEARQIVAGEASSTQVTRGVNQAYQTSELALQEREAMLVAVSARSESLEKKLAAARDALKQINDYEVQLARLEREIDIARTNYRRYTDNLEQARIDRELQNAKISSLNLMQPPSLTQTPVSPNPKLTLALGIVLAGVAGLGVALIAEQRRISRLAVWNESPALAPRPLERPALRPRSSPAASA